MAYLKYLDEMPIHPDENVDFAANTLLNRLDQSGQAFRRVGMGLPEARSRAARLVPGMPAVSFAFIVDPMDFGLGGGGMRAKTTAPSRSVIYSAGRIGANVR